MCPFSVRADVCCARSFSWKPALSFSVLAEAFRMHRASPYAHRISLVRRYLACPSYSSSWLPEPSPSLHRHTSGTGISTRRPSATPFGLALGPDYPREDEPSSGDLGPSVRGILTHVPLPHAGILSSMRSTCPSGHASPLHAMLPYHIPVHSFGVMLSPGKLSAQSHSTSELLRTL